MGLAIRTEGLTRRFGKVTAVEGLDLAVRRGSITAFLGPNGAGKTTTISLLLGLLKAHSGTCEVLGFPPGHPQALSQLGAMVESPSLYEHLTGRENLEITRLMRGNPRTEVDRVLAVVGLQNDAKRPVRTYSLGMRQRLGIGLALLGQPNLLILDEPTNGLDPAGIQEIRELIRHLPQDTGATIFLSSHVLAEVGKVAQDVVVIHRGRLRYQGPLESMGGNAHEEGLLIRVNDPTRGTQRLAEQGFLVHERAGTLWVQAPPQKAPHLANLMVNSGLDLYELSPATPDLEARFLALLDEA